MSGIKTGHMPIHAGIMAIVSVICPGKSQSSARVKIMRSGNPAVKMASPVQGLQRSIRGCQSVLAEARAATGGAITRMLLQKTTRTNTNQVNKDMVRTLKKCNKWKPRKYWCEKSNNWKKLHHIPMGRKGIKTCFNCCELPFC